MRRSNIALVIALLAVAFAGCAGNGRAPGGVSFESPALDSESSPAGDSEILAFKAPKLGGGQVDGGDLQGKDVAIWFWAPW